LNIGQILEGLTRVWAMKYAGTLTARDEINNDMAMMRSGLSIGLR